MNNRRGRLFVVSGASGVGKTTVVDKFLHQFADVYNIDKVVAYTTRSPRPGDVNGVDYHFISDEEFEAKIKEGFFLEWSGEYGSLYGTPRYILDDLDQGKSWILVIDRRGAQQIAAHCNKAVLILITVTSLSIIKDRLRSRAAESEEQILSRIEQSIKEIEEEKADSIYLYKVNNDFLKAAISDFKSLVEGFLED